MPPPPAAASPDPASTSSAGVRCAPSVAPAPRRALVVMAHPDDIEGTCGGTVAKLCRDGWSVSYCLVTSGDKGSNDETLRPWQLAAIREAEQEAAARLLGVQRCFFLRWPDGFVEDTAELRGAVVRCLRTVRPHLLITWDGYRGFNHRDHRTVGIVALDAAFPLSRKPHYFPAHAQEGLASHRVNEVLLAGSREPDYFVDVGAQLDRKIDALRCHVSQMGDGAREEFAKRWRDRAERAAAAGGLPWAEGFRRLLFGDRSAPRRADVLAAQRAAREQAGKDHGG